MTDQTDQTNHAAVLAFSKTLLELGARPIDEVITDDTIVTSYNLHGARVMLWRTLNAEGDPIGCEIFVPITTSAGVLDTIDAVKTYARQLQARGRQAQQKGAIGEVETIYIADGARKRRREIN